MLGEDVFQLKRVNLLATRDDPIIASATEGNVPLWVSISAFVRLYPICPLGSPTAANTELTNHFFANFLTKIIDDLGLHPLERFTNRAWFLTKDIGCSHEAKACFR